MLTDKLPRIAVCLAAYNGVRWLHEQVESILDQQEVEVVIFASIDASSDGTESWFDARAAADARIQVLPHGEHFGGAARNFFRLLREVEFSDFDGVCFADQDDIWLPDKLAHACRKLAEDGADAYSSNVTAFWPDGRRLLIDKAQPQRRWDFIFEAAGPGCTYVLSVPLAQAIQDAVRANGQIEEHAALHDWFMYAFTRARGLRWVIDSYPGVLYRQHGGNQVGANSGWPAAKRRLVKMFGGWWFGQAQWIARLVGQEDSPIVARGLKRGRLGTLWLATQARHCRRRLLEQWVFVAFCIVLSIIGRKPG